MLISPSILSADFANLQSELAKIANADYAHVDVMDGHFVPNLTIGLPVVQSLRSATELPLDCHLMIEDPGRWVERYVEAGASSVTFHVEATDDPRAVARRIRGAGAKAGVSLKPGTPWEPYAELVGEIDLVLVMTVEPGFGGQSFMPDMMPKVAAVRRSVDAAGADLRVQVDGGVSTRTIATCAAAGADFFVAGSAVFGSDDPAAAVEALRSGAVGALA